MTDKERRHSGVGTSQSVKDELAELERTEYWIFLSEMGTGVFPFFESHDNCYPLLQSIAPLFMCVSL